MLGAKLGFSFLSTSVVSGELQFILHPLHLKDATKEGLVCPSSVAAYLSKLGYNVSVCSPQLCSSRRYGVELPDWNMLEHDELLEWLGAVAVGVDMSREDAEGQYLSSYRGTNEAAGESQVAVLNFSGFFTPTRIQRLHSVFR
ncbi:Ribonuclease P protein subunit p40 [Homalodisca vitripennis]|nr:Ribonuclease P protein subunit p40 [Homalodisca vitripennis]